MIHVPRPSTCLLVTMVCLGASACQLRRPNTTPSRMIEPQLLEPQLLDPQTQVIKSTNAISVRLLDTQAREQIGRHLLHQQPNGELTEDAVWRWSAAPDRYLDSALRLEVASIPNVRLVDSSSATALAATLLAWNLDSTGGKTQLVGAVEFQVTRTDRVVRTQVVRSSEAVAPELPGDLAPAAGHLLRRLAAEGLAFAVSE